MTGSPTCSGEVACMPTAKPPNPPLGKRPVRRRQRVLPPIDVLKKQKTGRPSIYRKEFAEQAHKLALLGMSDAEIADFLCVGKSTFCQWKQKHNEFMNALEKGRAWADAEVASSLYQRAIGCEIPEIHVSNYQGEITLTETKRHYPPDIQSIKYWLNNRQSRHWRDRVEVKEEIDLHLFPERDALEGVYTRIVNERQHKEALLTRRLKQLEDMSEQDGHDD